MCSQEGKDYSIGNYEVPALHTSTFRTFLNIFKLYKIILVFSPIVLPITSPKLSDDVRGERAKRTTETNLPALVEK